MNLPDSDFSIDFATGNDANIYSTISTSTEAFFEGSDPTAVFKGADVNFSNKKLVLREIGTANKHSYTNRQMVAGNSGKNILDGFGEEFTLKDDKTTSGTTLDTFDLIGIGDNASAATRDNHLNGDGSAADKVPAQMQWVDEKILQLRLLMMFLTKDYSLKLIET